MRTDLGRKPWPIMLMSCAHHLLASTGIT